MGAAQCSWPAAECSCPAARSLPLILPVMLPQYVSKSKSQLPRNICSCSMRKLKLDGQKTCPAFSWFFQNVLLTIHRLPSSPSFRALVHSSGHWAQVFLFIAFVKDPNCKGVIPNGIEGQSVMSLMEFRDVSGSGVAIGATSVVQA